MSINLLSDEVIVLIKALPQPSKNHGETVCCAGITLGREWKRLYPIRFRHLKDKTSFQRWDVIDFRFKRPLHDSRRESCHVFEDTIEIRSQFPKTERPRLLEPMIVGSGEQATAQGMSLALIRPKNTKFMFKKKPLSMVELERKNYQIAASQTSFLDIELKAFEPPPYIFSFTFKDAAGEHTYRCGDWETYTTFWKWRKLYGEASALKRLSVRYNEEYPSQGLAFAIGNIVKRQWQWQLLGVIRLDISNQTEMF